MGSTSPEYALKVLRALIGIVIYVRPLAKDICIKNAKLRNFYYSPPRVRIDPIFWRFDCIKKPCKSTFAGF